MRALTGKGALQIDVDRGEDGTTVFELRGDLDFKTAHALQNALDDAIDRGVDRIVLDLSPLRFCDSSGLQVVVSAFHRLTMGGGRLAVVCSDPRVLRVFHVTRLDRILGVSETRLEAFGRLAAAV